MPSSAPSAETPPAGGDSRWQWMMLLAGPVLWITHFAVVYLAAEAVCGAEAGRGPELPGPGHLVALVGVATAVAVAVIGVVTLRVHRASRRGGDDGFFALAGVLLGIGSIAAVLAVGVPALVMDPCAM